LIEEKERILVIADTHLLSKEDVTKKKILKEEGRLSFSEGLLINFFEGKGDWVRQQYFLEMVRRVNEIKRTNGPFSHLIDLGDATSGSNNQGLVSSGARKERREYNEKINTVFSGMKKRSVWGNHDVGFQDWFTKILNLGWSEGISIKSFNAAEEMTGPAWDIFKIKKFNFLILNSEIIRAVNTIGSIDYLERRFFIDKEKEQRNFIEEAFKETLKEDKDSKFILLIHDPVKLESLWPILEPYTSLIDLTLAGHLHFATSARILKKYSRIYRELKLEVVPSPWPWGSWIVKQVTGRNGGGFVTLEISDSSFEINHHWLFMPDLD